ncbi:hypothetical protein IFM89_003511 [Coptis chinensis]|uniref:Ubiquitin-fold modifier-conjugating enzyme 1 n=1 Tax=Coptis chinensis TaxID=261450 RepID=A0A835HAM0_9MAGN|nr:hypothetical protein IFM89_003511 [Coptis chinensis]
MHSIVLTVAEVLKVGVVPNHLKICLLDSKNFLLEVPELDGKTHKMYKGGKICLTVHFKPLWATNRYVECLFF